MFRIAQITDSHLAPGWPRFDANFTRVADAVRQARPDAVISVGAYAACAAFIRDARDAGWKVPIANISFVGSENLLSHLQQTGKERGKDYTDDLINSQVVPSYEDQELPAVAEYRELMARHRPRPPGQFTPSGQRKSHGLKGLQGFAWGGRSMASRLRFLQPVRQISVGPRAEGQLFQPSRKRPPQAGAVPARAKE